MQSLRSFVRCRAVKTALACDLWLPCRMSLGETMSFGFLAPYLGFELCGKLPLRDGLWWGSGGNRWPLGRARWHRNKLWGWVRFPVTWLGVIVEQATTTEVRELAELLRRSPSPLPSIFMPDRSTVDGQTRCCRCACENDVPCLLMDLVVHELQECVGRLGQSNKPLFCASACERRRHSALPSCRRQLDVGFSRIGCVWPKFQVQLPPSWVLLQHATREKYHECTAVFTHPCLVQR